MKYPVNLNCFNCGSVFLCQSHEEEPLCAKCKANPKARRPGQGISPKDLNELKQEEMKR